MKSSLRPAVRTVKTPVGDLILAASAKALVALVFRKADLRRLGFAAWDEGAPSAVLDIAERQLAEYFRGGRSRFDLPLDLKGTDFQRKVWAALGKIPFGETWSYAELAARVGHPKAVRAVGTANGANPVCILVPCHRVIRATGAIGGYAGGVGKKALLLDLEKRLA